MVASWSSGQDEHVRGHDLFKHQFWGRIVKDVGRAAEAAGGDDQERAQNVWLGLEVVDIAARAVNPGWWHRDENTTPLAWHHDSRPTLAGKKHDDPHITRLDVEEATAEYLALPYRVERLDRLLTDMLIAAEMFAFADEMQPQLKRKLPTVLAWLWSNIKSLVVGLSIAGVLVWLAPETSFVLWIAGMIAGLTILGTAFSLIVFPFVYPGVRAQRQKFNATIMAMVDAYAALSGSPGSVSHIRRLVDRATDSGVVWPAPLMALLDDVASRRNTI